MPEINRFPVIYLILYIIQCRVMWETPAGIQKQPSSEYIHSIHDRPNDFRILERIPLVSDDIPYTLSEPQKDDIAIVTVDCETTGLGYDDNIIELGMARCRYNRIGELVGIDETLDMFEDPSKPLPPHITELTHITDAMVCGKHIDRDAVQSMLQDDPLIVAHNASFDRPKFERLFQNNCRWSCTMVGLPWVDMGHRSYSLDIILQREGWFYDTHRAINDCLAIAWLLHVIPDSLHMLLAPTVKIMAIDAPRDLKDTLKSRGYRWDPIKKYWWILRREADSDDELASLKQYCAGVGMAHKRKFCPHTEFR